MKQSMGFSKRAAGRAMGATGGQGLPSSAAALPPPGLPCCPRSAPVLPWFSPNSVFTSFLSFQRLLHAGVRPAMSPGSTWGEGGTWDCPPPPQPPIILPPRGTPVLASGTADPHPKHPSGLVSTTAQSTPLQRCTHSTGAPKCSPPGGTAERGPTSLGALHRNNFRKPIPGEEQAPSRPSPASQPRRA